MYDQIRQVKQLVSTHSRPKAAGRVNLMVQKRLILFQHTAARRRLDDKAKEQGDTSGFNTQPPEGGWEKRTNDYFGGKVSTHSRPKAAGKILCDIWLYRHGFNTQPPEGGWRI